MRISLKHLSAALAAGAATIAIAAAPAAAAAPIMGQQAMTASAPTVVATDWHGHGGHGGGWHGGGWHGDGWHDRGWNGGWGWPWGPWR